MGEIFLLQALSERHLTAMGEPLAFLGEAEV